MSGIGGGGGSRKNSAGCAFLTKNSVIKCSIDDLQLDEGLLVVSFAHKDNLYQGVLLQLNRERGIPVGISFPKDYFSEDKKSLESEQPVPAPQPPPPPPPLAQRNTYFQETDNGRQYRSLRRVIKTPARFKNSRMSLRPVQRPILCAKCGALCSEKDKDNAASGGPQTCNPSTTNDEVVESKSKKNNGDSSPKKSLASAVNSNNNSKSKDIKSKLELNPKVRLSKLPPPPTSNATTTTLVEEDPMLDYNYKGVGSKGVVDNVWKRPLNKPLKYQTRHAVNSAANNLIMKLVAPSRLKKAPTKIVKSSEKEATNKLPPPLIPAPSKTTSTCPVFRITRAPLKSTDKSRKANNLKLCIKRLTMAAQEAKLEVNDDHKEAELKKPIKPSKAAVLDVVPPMKIPIRKTTTKLKLKRRNSTMPFRRFYDNNSPTWRTRKVSTMSNPDKLNYFDEDDVSNNPLRLSLKSLSKDSDRVVDYQIIDQIKKSPTAAAPSSNKLEAEQQQLYPLLSSDLSPIQSPEEFDNDSEGEHTPPPPILSNNKPEPSKTPVIKITFGTSGNGVVVEIPSRNTNNQDDDCNNETPLEEGTSTSTSEMESKAVRKALKKARKEAKRKQSEKIMLPQPPSLTQYPPVLDANITTTTTTPFSPLSSSTKSPALTPLTIHLNSGSSSGCSQQQQQQQPHYVTSPIRACSPHNNLLVTTFSTPLTAGESTAAAAAMIDGNSESGEWYGKKKKKAKKRKRQKDHKENDHEDTHTHHHRHQHQHHSTAPTVNEIIASPGLQQFSSSSPTFKSEIINPPPTTMMNNGDPSIPPPPSNELISPGSRSSDDGVSVLLPISNPPKRVCISLKRLKDQSNAYVPSWTNNNSSSSSSSGINCSLLNSSADEHNNGTASDSATEAENDDEPHEFEDESTNNHNNSSPQGIMESIESYNHVLSNQNYKKGDVVWGKSTGCPWWPGKIVDIQQLREGASEDARAKIAWYKSAKQSCLAFADLHPFEEFFETKYTKNRKRGCYQQAVKEACEELARCSSSSSSHELTRLCH